MGRWEFTCSKAAGANRGSCYRARVQVGVYVLEGSWCQADGCYRERVQVGVCVLEVAGAKQRVVIERGGRWKSACSEVDRVWQQSMEEGGREVGHTETKQQTASLAGQIPLQTCCISTADLLY